MGTRALNDLSTDFRPLVRTLISNLVERDIMHIIVQTSRTLSEHQQNIAAKTSWVSLSKHLPRALRGFPASELNAGKSDAIDLCPYASWIEYGPKKLNWDATDPAFTIMGELGEALALRWGGRWQQKDLGHFELLFPGEHYDDIPPTSAAYRSHGRRPLAPGISI